MRQIIGIVMCSGAGLLGMDAPLAAQVTELSVTRATFVTACSDDGCDIPAEQRSTALGPLTQSRTADAFDFFTYTEALACADQTSTIPPGGPYDGMLVASGSVLNDFGAGNAEFLSDTSFQVTFLLEAPCTLRLTGTFDLGVVDGTPFGGADLASSVLIEIAGDLDQVVLDQFGEAFGTFDQSVELAPGTYDLTVTLLASAAVVDTNGGASALASCTFNAMLECDAIPGCLCERGGDPAEVDVQDLLLYLESWLDSAPDADIDGGGVSIVDLLLYLDCYFEVILGTPC